MIRAMAKAPKKQKNYVRPTPEAWHAMKRLWTAMQAPSLFGKDLLQEDFIAATWLWLAGMDVADVARGIAPHVAAVQAYWAAMGEQEAPVPAPAPAPAADTTAPARRVPGSTGKAARGKQNSG